MLFAEGLVPRPEILAVLLREVVEVDSPGPVQDSGSPSWILPDTQPDATSILVGGRSG